MRRAEQLSKLGIELTRAEDLQAVAYILREFTLRLWDWDAFVFVVRRSQTSAHFQTILLVDTIDGERVNISEDESHIGDYSVTWNQLLEGKSILVNREDSATILEMDFAFGDVKRMSQSLLFVPIVISGKMIGVVSVQSYTPRKFVDEDIYILEHVAEVVAPKLLRCHSEVRMREFLRLGERLNQVVDTSGVTRVVANTAASLIGWDFLSLHICNTACSQMNLVLGLRRSATDSQIISDETTDTIGPDSIIWDVLRGRAVSLDTTAMSDEDLKRLLPFGNGLPLLSSVILAPIRSMNRVMGLLCIQSESYGAYGADETDIARALTDYCSGALERAWAQQNLSEREESYRLLVENVNDAIVISQDERFIFINTQFASMLGYDVDELQRLSYKEVYTEEGLQILNGRAQLRLEGHVVPDRYETIFRKKCGENIPVEASVRIITDYRGKPATFAVIRDIRERKEAEKKLRESEGELRTLIHAMTDTIMVMDDKGIYLRHSADGYDCTPHQDTRFTGKSIFDIYSHEKAQYFINLVTRSLSSQKPVNVEYDLECSAGNQRWYNATITPFSKTTVLIVARDVTSRRQADEELFRSNARYEALLDGSEDYIFVLDRELRFVHVNSVVHKRFGIPTDQRVGRRLFDIYGNSEPPPFVKLIQKVFQTGQPVTYDDDAVVNGNLICTETVISPVFDRDGTVEAVLGISRDVTSRRRDALALQESEQRYALAVRGANDGIWDWDMVADTIYLAPRWWAILGEDEPKDNEFKVSVWFDRIHPSDAIALREKIADHLKGRTPHLEDEHRMMHSDGTYRWVLCRGICVRDEAGNPVQMAGSIGDIHARKSAEEKLQYNASHDTLTQLPNRAHFIGCLAKIIARVRRRSPDKEQFAVLFLDLDRFKVINDSLGHMAGDELIIAVARRLELCVRPSDLVARLGGDEFTILLEDLNSGSDATKIAQRIIDELSAPINIFGYPVHTTVSIGIAFDRPEYSQPEDLLRDADTAMYRAKETGRNRYQVFDQHMHQRAMEQLHLEGDLRRAVARQEFVMHYQPVYNLSSGKLSGFEALIRWNHPERGMVMPGSFIPLAEENGIIVPIGWWVIDQSARACANFNSDRDANDQLSISINISPVQFSQPNFVSHFSFLIKNAGVLPANVIVEITENCLMDESQNVGQVMQELRDLGVRLDLDDFGTGYSSLSFLRRFPLDLLKIDQSFVKDLGKDAQGREIISAIIALAGGMGLRVTAEGVETKEQLEALVEMKCDWAQGFLLNYPMAYDQALAFAREDSYHSALVSP